MPPADTTHIDCASTLRTLLPSQSEQASTTLTKKGRPASAAASSRPTRSFSGTLPKPKAAMPAVNSQTGQHAQHDPLSPQAAVLQSLSQSATLAAGSNDGYLSQPLRQQASQALAMPAQPELGKTTLSRFTLRRPSKLALLPNEPMSQDGSLSLATSRRSPKPTLLRDQHMPGEVLHQRSAFPSDIFMRHEAACSRPTSPQLDTASAATQRSSPSATLHHARSATGAQGNPSGGSSTLRPKSPKATLLRDQHLPGELLHQKTAFPSDIYMRHEAACAPGLAKQPSNDTDSVLEARDNRQSSTAGMPQQQQVLDAEVSGSTMPHAAAVKQSTLPRAVSSTAAHMQVHADGGIQAALTPNTRLHSTSKALTTRPPRVGGNLMQPSPGGTSREAAFDASLLQGRDGDRQAVVPLKLQRKGSKDAGLQPKSSLKRADSKLQKSSQVAPTSPRSLAGPWFEATHHHDLARNKTWAREWLEMEGEDDDPTNPEFVQMQQQQQLSQRGSEHPSSLLMQQPTQKHTVPQPGQQTTQHFGQSHNEYSCLQQQPKDQTSHQASQKPAPELLPSPEATTRSDQRQTLPSGAVGTCTHSAEHGAHAMQQQTSTRQLSQSKGRPQTAPEGFWSVAADAPWALDVRRLHSARPGSGGSPTARYRRQLCRDATCRLNFSRTCACWHWLAKVSAACKGSNQKTVLTIIGKHQDCCCSGAGKNYAHGCSDAHLFSTLCCAVSRAAVLCDKCLKATSHIC